MRKGSAVFANVLAAFAIALVPIASAGAGGDPAVNISANCGGAGFCFVPSTLTISDGATVIWTNSSGTLHFVGRCDPSSCDGASGGSGTDATFTSAQVADGATYSHTFHGPGTYTYFCAIHGYAAMHGVIVVNGAEVPSTATTVAPSTTATSVTTASTPGSVVGATPESAAASTPVTVSGPRLASTGPDTGGTLALGIGALVLGLAAWGACIPRRGVVPRLRR